MLEKLWKYSKGYHVEYEYQVPLVRCYLITDDQDRRPKTQIFVPGPPSKYDLNFLFRFLVVSQPLPPAVN